MIERGRIAVIERIFRFAQGQMEPMFVADAVRQRDPVSQSEFPSWGTKLVAGPGKPTGTGIIFQTGANAMPPWLPRL